MPVIPDTAIAGYARAAGLSGGSIATAVAVALAESGGNTGAHNPIGLDNSYGLWQINMLGSLGPERRQALGISTNDALYDPGVNARAMAMISSGGSNWRPWTTYTSGKYRLYLSRAETAAGSPSDVSLPGATPMGLSFGNIEKGLDYISSKETWMRAGLLLGGGALLFMAVRGVL